jgi:hypothetical protein
MTAATLKKYRTITYDDKGKPVSVVLNLKNKIMREAYNKALEEIEDRMDMDEANRRLTDGSELMPWEEAKKKIYQKVVSK